MERRAVHERKWFTPEEKEEMLKKSDYKCCHCGIGIKNKDGFTCEHVIPLSKGGSNDMKNMVALCTDCNKKKSNYIVPAVDYYKYLKEEYKKEIAEVYKDYLVDWFDVDNYMPYDKINIKVVSNALVSHCKKGNRSCIPIMATYSLQKAVYSDLDEAYYFNIKYQRKKFGKCDNDFIKYEISQRFNRGGVYIVRDNSGKIVLYIQCSVNRFEDENGKQCFLCIEPPICMYDSYKYLELMIYSIQYLVGNFAYGMEMEYMPFMLIAYKGSILYEAICSTTKKEQYSTDDDCGYFKILMPALDENMKFKEGSSEAIPEKTRNKEYMIELENTVSKKINKLIEQRINSKRSN